MIYFVFAFIFFEMSDTMDKHHYMKMGKLKDLGGGNDKHHKIKIERYVPFNNEYVLDTKTGEVFKPIIK